MIFLFFPTYRPDFMGIKSVNVSNKKKCLTIFQYGRRLTGTATAVLFLCKMSKFSTNCFEYVYLLKCVFLLLIRF